MEQLSFNFDVVAEEAPPAPTVTSGPTVPLSKEIWQQKYASGTETHAEAMARIAKALGDSEEHTAKFQEILSEMRFLPAGRIQAGAGSPKRVTLMNCYVSGTIEDSMESIMATATQAAETMRMGGGIGYNFSNIRPRGDYIKSLDSRASGPVSFMGIFDAVCQTIASAGHRRGAQMGVLNCSHPSIREFIRAKRNQDRLKGFNVSVAVTDEFMEAVKADGDFNLRFKGKIYETVRARELWDEIMLSTWDWAEPGVLFIDRINNLNNLRYVEYIDATNPCGEQPLGPHSACLLGSFNLVKYLREDTKEFDWETFIKDIPVVVQAMDNVNDISVFPLPEQREQALAKRRMGLGITGAANALEFLGYPYASVEYLAFQDKVLDTLKNVAYQASSYVAKMKGPFPLFDRDKYLSSPFIQGLSKMTQDMISAYGIRNSHLISIAPTGTISLSADNISSGIEPVFSHSYTRQIQAFDGPVTEEVKDYGYARWGLKGRTANECSVYDHVQVLANAQKHSDSAVSKTCNVGERVTFDEFKDVYMLAYEKGCKGITTFRAAGKRYGILNETTKKDDKPEQEATLDVAPAAEACYINPITGAKECG